VVESPLPLPGRNHIRAIRVHPWQKTAVTIPKKEIALFFRKQTYWRKRRDLLHPPKKIFCQS
jgi:hypothetical protein